MPDVLPRLLQAGLDVLVETGAGVAAHYPDQAYVEAGAKVTDDPLADADVVVSVEPLPADRVRQLSAGAITVSFLPVTTQPELARVLRDQSVTAFSLELVPRISRAQSMDALSSQALVAGYRAVIVAAERLPGFFPLLMTAAGTVPPAKVLVLGAGVAGLQAIATARRLGAVVSAYDVRAAAAEEIRSMGARFVELELPSLEGSGGYAREMTEERSRLQRELLAPHVADADALITTAAVPGRTAPLLVTREMVAAMRPGSVVIDLAADSGGNVEGSVAGEEIRVQDVLLWGGLAVPSQMPVHASRLYASNVTNLLLLMTSDGHVVPDFDDEIVDTACVTHDGQVRHEATRVLLEGGA